MSLVRAIALVFGAIGAGLVSVALARLIKAEHWGLRATAGAVLILIALAMVQGDQPDASSAGSDASSPSSTTVMTPDQESTPSSPVATTSETDQPPVQATSLLDLPVVAEDTNDSIDLDALESTEVDGTTYGQLLAYQCSLYCDGGSPQVREVTLGRKFATFEATFAVLDTATGRHRLDITLDSRRPKSYFAEPGKPASVVVSVNDVSRMRLQLYSPGPLKSPLAAGADAAVGGNGGGLPGAALCDPIVLP